MPLIGRIHGAALGGGAGLAAVCDIVVADERTMFGFTEVKLGILPAMIVAVRAREDRRVRRAGAVPDRHALRRRAREGDRPGARGRAGGPARIGGSRDYVKEILSAGPGSDRDGEGTAEKGRRARRVQDTIGLTADTIAARRASAEGQEGMRAFLEKRKASWNVYRIPIVECFAGS